MLIRMGLFSFGSQGLDYTQWCVFYRYELSRQWIRSSDVVGDVVGAVASAVADGDWSLTSASRTSTNRNVDENSAPKTPMHNSITAIIRLLSEDYKKQQCMQLRSDSLKT